MPTATDIPDWAQDTQTVPDWAQDKPSASDSLKRLPVTSVGGDIVRSSIGAVQKALGITADEARGALSDAVDTATLHPGYGGNLTAAVMGKELPVDVQNRQLAAKHPYLAAASMTAQGAAGTAPFLLMADVPAIVQRATALGFSAQMIAGVKDLATQYGEEMGKPEAQRDQAKIAQLRANMVQTGVFAPLAGAYGLRGKPKPPTPPTTGAKNASTITSPESVPQPEVRPPVGEETPLPTVPAPTIMLSRDEAAARGREGVKEIAAKYSLSWDEAVALLAKERERLGMVRDVAQPTKPPAPEATVEPKPLVEPPPTAPVPTAKPVVQVRMPDDLKNAWYGKLRRIGTIGKIKELEEGWNEETNDPHQQHKLELLAERKAEISDERNRGDALQQFFDESSPEMQRKIDAHLEKLNANRKLTPEEQQFDDFLEQQISQRLNKSKTQPSAVPAKPAPKAGEGEEKTEQDFINLGRLQRDAPEKAMGRVLDANGGGVLDIVEPVGDLLHRMNDQNTFDYAGYDTVKEKVERGLRALTDKYGFDKEFNENIRNNAKYDNVPEQQFREKLDKALLDYANEHRKLPTFNRAQKLAQEAAVALGEKRWGDATIALQGLNQHLRSQKEWVTFAREGLKPTPSAVVGKGETTGKVARKNFFIRPRSYGIHDILDEVQEHGGIRSPEKGDVGGEYDGHKEAMVGTAALLRRSGRGLRPDIMVQAVQKNFPHIKNADDLYEAIKSASKERDALRKGGGGEEARSQRFWDAVSKPEGAKGVEKINVDQLQVGQKFRLKAKGVSNEELEVVAINPDDNTVTVKDGTSFGVQDMPEGAEIYIKKGSLVKANEEFQSKNQPELVPLGASTPGDLRSSSSTPTGIKITAIDAQRAARGEEPLSSVGRRSFKTEVWQAALAKVDNDPQAPAKLVNTMMSDQVAGEVKPLSDGDVAMLLYREAELTYERSRLAREMAVAADDARQFPNRAEALQRLTEQKNRVDEDLNTLEKVIAPAKSETARGLAALRNMVGDSYNLESMRYDFQKKTSHPLTEADEAFIKSEFERIDSAEKQRLKDEAEYRAAEADAEANRAREDLIDSVGREPKEKVEPVEPHVRLVAAKLKTYFKTNADAALERIRARHNGTTSMFSGVPLHPEDFDDAVIFGASKMFEKGISGAEMSADWATEMASTFGDGIKSLLQTIWAKANQNLDAGFKKIAGVGPAAEKAKRATRPKVGARDHVSEKKAIIEGIKEAVADGEGDVNIGRYANAIAKNFVRKEVESGRVPKDIKGEEIDAAVHEVLKDFIPEISPVESRDAWTQYGKFKPPTQDPIKIRMAEARAEQQKLSTIERLQKGLPGLMTGFGRAKATDLLRRRIAQINELKRQLGIVTTDPATQLRSALEAKLTRQKNRIADLKFENSTRKRIVREKTPSPDNEETLRNKAEIDELEKQNREIFGNRTLSDAQKLKMATAAAEKSAKDWEQKLVDAKQGKFTRPQAKKSLTSKELEAIKARRDAAKAEFKELQALDPASQAEAEDMAVNRRLTQLANRTADYLDRAAKQDFKPKPKRISPIKTQAALQKVASATAKADTAKREWENAAEKYRRAHRTTAERVVDVFVDTYHLPRSIAVLYHGTVGMVTHAGALAFRGVSGATIWWRNFKRQFPMWLSPKYHEVIIYKLKTDPEFQTWKDAGASIDPNEIYTDYGLYAKFFGGFTGGARGFDALKLTRFELNKADWKTVSSEIKNDPEQALLTRKRIADINNRATGAVGSSKDVFSEVAKTKIAEESGFAPRLYASRWGRIVLDPIKTVKTAMNWESAIPADKVAAKIRLRHAGYFIAGYASALAVNQGLLIATGSKQRVNFTDFTKSSTWLKFVVGGKVITADGGLLDPVRLLGEVVIGDLIMPRTKKDIFLHGNRFQKAGMDLLKYGRGKINPSLGLVVDVGTGSDYAGRPLPFSNEKPQFKDQTRYSLQEYLLSKGPIPLSIASKEVYDEMVKNGMSSVQAMDIVKGSGLLVFTMTGAHLTEDYKFDKETAAIPSAKSTPAKFSTPPKFPTWKSPKR
jgi:hypothetical protein